MIKLREGQNPGVENVAIFRNETIAHKTKASIIYSDDAFFYKISTKDLEGEKFLKTKLSRALLKKKMTPTEATALRSLKVANVVGKIALGGETWNYLRRSKDEGVPLYQWTRYNVGVDIRRQIINDLFTTIRYLVKGLC